MAHNTPSRYRIYLLTMWEERSRDPEVPVQWRFSLEHPATGQRQGFASLEALVAALQDLGSSKKITTPNFVMRKENVTYHVSRRSKFLGPLKFWNSLIRLPH